MTKSDFKKSPAAYPDVRKTLEIALDNEELIIKFDSLGAAINFVQRCYRYRSVLREHQFERNGGIPGLPIETPYDDMKISYIEKEPGKRQSKTIKITFYKNDSIKMIDPKTGKEITGAEERTPFIDPSEIDGD